MRNIVIDALRPIQFRGKAALLQHLVSHGGVRTARVHDCAMELDLCEFIQRMMYLGTYERHETRLVRKYLCPGMTFVDVGANVGYYTTLAAHVGPKGKVFAVEPVSRRSDASNG